MCLFAGASACPVDEIDRGLECDSEYWDMQRSISLDGLERPRTSSAQSVFLFLHTFLYIFSS